MGSFSGAATVVRRQHLWQKYTSLWSYIRLLGQRLTHLHRSVMFNLRVYWRTSFLDVWSVTAPYFIPSHLLCADNLPFFLYPCSPVWLFFSLVVDQAGWPPEASCCHSLVFKIIPIESSSFLSQILLFVFDSIFYLRSFLLASVPPGSYLLK